MYNRSNLTKINKIKQSRVFKYHLSLLPSDAFPNEYLKTNKPYTVITVKKKGNIIHVVTVIWKLHEKNQLLK